jgi:hypothetical protein
MRRKHLKTIRAIVGGAQVPARIIKNLIISIDRPVSHEATTSLVWGTDDDLVPMKVARRLASRFRFPLYTVSNAGHLPQLENPAEFIEILFNAAGLNWPLFAEKIPAKILLKRNVKVMEDLSGISAIIKAIDQWTRAWSQ